MKRILSVLLFGGVLTSYSSGYSQEYGKTRPGDTGGVEVINAGVGGNTSGDLLKRVNADVIQQQPDMVLVMVGTNDMVNSGKLTSFEMYKKNLKTMIDVCKADSIQVLLMSPPPVDTLYLFQRHDREKFNALPNDKLDSVRSIMAKLAADRDLIFIDLQSEFIARGLPRHNADEVIMNVMNSGYADGVHPTAEGYAFIGRLIYDRLLKEKLFHKDIKIVCFGDSITYGSRVEGAGTSTGDTYPAVLLRLIEQSVQ